MDYSQALGAYEGNPDEFTHGNDMLIHRGPEWASLMDPSWLPLRSPDGIHHRSLMSGDIEQSTVFYSFVVKVQIIKFCGNLWKFTTYKSPYTDQMTENIQNFIDMFKLFFRQFMDIYGK
ncbi:uncharacterized protein LOC117171021 [Belonocnema kinseyi]|uniref:uncharacterized protein LOC117171021 n=1 Tax=Belonocnema kinseyi TaxID=2817044 RepID=UPI00143CC1DC|nr:uncharacterized protein LOC117171021 [Belonocnema kinseyi]